jgi:hypothetical protein
MTKKLTSPEHMTRASQGDRAVNAGAKVGHVAAG